MVEDDDSDADWSASGTFPTSQLIDVPSVAGRYSQYVDLLQFRRVTKMLRS